MTWRLQKIRNFMEEHEKNAKRSEIISFHFEVPPDDERVLCAADEIFTALFGQRTHVDP
jgi:hypothetical protein